MLNGINLGIIGLGYVGKVHLINALKNENIKQIFVSDKSKKSLILAKKLGVNKLYENYSDLLEKNEIDAVIIALPNHLHKVCAITAAEHGKHILLEKPIARSVEEGNEITRAVKTNDIKLMMGYHYRFTDTFMNLKNMISNMEIGEVILGNAVNVSSGPFFHRADKGVPNPVPEWWFSKDISGGGAVLDLGCHMLNLLNWFFGEVEDVRSIIGYKYNLDVEDHALCTLKYKKGPIINLTLGWFSQHGLTKIDLNGTLENYSAVYSPPGGFHNIINMIFQS